MVILLQVFGYVFDIFEVVTVLKITLGFWDGVTGLTVLVIFVVLGIWLMVLLDSILLT